jgi:hypothetical protein
LNLARNPLTAQRNVDDGPPLQTFMDLKIKSTCEPLAHNPVLGSAFAESDTYRRLHREMERYVSGQTNGGSFLIAGHRGAGKTWLVHKAIERLQFYHLSQPISAAAEYSETLQDVVTKWPKADPNEIQQPPTSSRREVKPVTWVRRLVNVLRRSRPMEARNRGLESPRRWFPRPILVRLHGPDLLVMPSAKHGIGTASLWTNQQTLDGRSLALHAMSEIGLALHRSLCEEMAHSFMQQAAIRDEDELAAEFQIELDHSPEPSRLLQLFKVLGRDREGVLRGQMRCRVQGHRTFGTR